MMWFIFFIVLYLLIGVKISLTLMDNLEAAIDRYESGQQLSEEDEHALYHLDKLNKSINNSEIWLYIITILFWLVFLIKKFVDWIGDKW